MNVQTNQMSGKQTPMGAGGARAQTYSFPGWAPSPLLLCVGGSLSSVYNVIIKITFHFKIT